MAILINDNSARVQYTATSSQTVFTVPFEFFANADLKVYQNSTLKTITTHYTVTGAGVTGGGTVTFVTGATLNDVITIVRDVAVARVTDFPTSGPFVIEDLNTDLDRLTAMIQQQETKLARTLRLDDFDTPNTFTVLPAKATRASKLLSFDANGNSETTLSAGDISSAQSYATAAAASAAAAAASLDAFDDIYLGAYSTNPTLDNDGNALTTGDQYFNTTANELRIWNGSSWQSPSVIGGTVATLNVSGVASFADGSAALPSITNNGDTNTGIFFPTEDTIAFAEGGVEAMRIDSSGNVGIGSTSLTDTSFRVSKNITGSTSSQGIRSDGAIQTDSTANAYYFISSANMASGTLGNLNHFLASQGTIGATVSSQTGFNSVASLIGATNNYAFAAANTAAVTAGKTAYGFYSAVNTATGGGTTYQFYAAGTAPSVINGTVTLGTPLAVSSGGTGATTANAALTNLTTLTSTATAGGTTVLTNTSTYFQYFTGTLTQTITLPVTSTLAQGWTFHIVNNSTGDLTVNSSGGNLVITVLAGTTAMATCILTSGTTAASWEAGLTDFSTATGTGSVVLATSPTLVTPVLGVASATSLSATTLTATAGAGFQNMVVQITGTSASYSLPAAVQVTGAKLKVTIVGGGGQGGGTTTTAGLVGGGGGGGGAIVVFLTYVAGQNTLTYTVGPGGSGAGTNAAGTAGTASSIIYNGVTYTAGGGGGGPTATTTGSGTGGTATGGTLNIVGQIGGAGGTSAATANMMGNGGNAGLGLGYGAPMPSATGTGNAAASGYGGGGSGGFNGATATARAGGAGAAGVVIIEY